MLGYRCQANCASYLLTARAMKDWKSDTGRNLLLKIQFEMRAIETLQAEYNVSSLRLSSLWYLTWITLDNESSHHAC